MLPLNHQIEDSPGGGPLPQFNIGHHKMLLVSVLQHLEQVFLQLLSEKESSGYFLDLHGFFLPFVEVDLNIVPGSVPSVQTLDQDGRTITLEDSAQSIGVYLKVENVLVS
jgi:hypothetical protein